MIEFLASARVVEPLLLPPTERRIKVERWRPPEDHCSNYMRDVGAHSTVSADPEDEPVEHRAHLETAHKALHEHDRTQGGHGCLVSASEKTETFSVMGTLRERMGTLKSS
jgi:hypothetical protein